MKPHENLLIFLMIVTTLTALFLLSFIMISRANEIYQMNGELINNKNYIQMWPVQFKNKIEADNQAKILENGQVFQDHDTKLYQVWYGNCEIVGEVITSNITQN